MKQPFLKSQISDILCLYYTINYCKERLTTELVKWKVYFLYILNIYLGEVI